MKVALPCFVFLVLVVNHELRSFVARGHSDDLSRALGALQRRRRWLEASNDQDNFRHQYGTVTHFPPSMRKRSSFGPYDSVATIPPEDLWRNRGFDDEDRKRKRSAFREREHQLEDERRRKKKKKRMMAKKNEDWENAEEQLQTMAQQRFLNAIMPPEEEQGLSSDEILNSLRREELVALLQKAMADSPEQFYYMEGEGPGESRKRVDKKRPSWQDGVRYSLGDMPDKRQDEGSWESSEEPPPAPHERWWSLADPRLLSALSEIEANDGSDEEQEGESEEVPDDDMDIRKKGVWLPDYDIRKRNRHALWSSFAPTQFGNAYKRLVPFRKKRGDSTFRERNFHDPGMAAYVGTSKRTGPAKRSPEEPVDVRKRMITKKSPSDTPPHVLKELKGILADEKDEKRVAKREEGDAPSSESFEDVVQQESVAPIQDLSGEEDLSEEEINDLALGEVDEKREGTRKRKRSWDDYFGMDKRQGSKREAKTNESAADPDVDNGTLVVQEQEPVGGDAARSAMNRYFKSMAAAMSSRKKKRTAEEKKDSAEEESNGRHPLSAMDRKLEAIENLMLEEALEMVEGRAGAAKGATREEQRERIIHRLDAAHSVEKMREALADFEDSLDRIHGDERPEGPEESDEDEDDKKKKKAVIKKENLAEALHVMAPQATKRTTANDVDISEENGGCPIFTEISSLCSELSKSANAQDALVGACSRHIMCYACDFAYEEGPRIPCDLVFMREAHDICGDDLYCRSAAAQMHGVLRQHAPVVKHGSVPVCLSEACVRSYRRR